MEVKMCKLLDKLKLKCLDSSKDIPLSLLVVLFINVVFYSMSINVVISYLPELVKYFGVTEVETGHYAGIIAASIYVGHLFFSMFWGYLTDTIGKKNSAVLTGSLLMLTTLGFGFSCNFRVSTVTRLIQGCAMGHMIVTKAILADICDDNTMSFGMAVLMTGASVGVLVGPSVGGFLVFPHQQYPKTFTEGNIFSKYVMLLPNFIVAGGLGIGVLLFMFFLPNNKKKDEEEHGHLLEWNKSIPCYGSTSVCVSGEANVDGTRVSSLGSPIIYNYINYNSIPGNESTNGIVVTAVTTTFRPSALQKLKKSKFATVLKIKECWLSSLLYGLLSIVSFGFGEIFPVFAATDPKYKGMGFTTSKIAIVYTVVSLFVTLLQLTTFPKLINRFGSKKVVIGSKLILSFLMPLLPSLAYIHRPAALWVCTLLLYFSILSCFFAAVLSVNVFVNNSVESELLGCANGMGMTFASAGRVIAPLVSGTLYSWSLTNIKGVEGNKSALGFPFNQYFVFFYLSLIAIGIALFTSRLPDAMNFKKVKLEKTSG